jgi:hypothetical protein
VSFEGLRPIADAGVGDWIAPRLRGFGGRVNQVVPDGFDAYVRVLHPPADERGEPATWAEVCRRTGRTPHALMQWQSIAVVVEHVTMRGRWPHRYPSSTHSSDWPGQEPAMGQAPPELLRPLLDVLGRFTAEPSECVHALWEGWGWLGEGSWAVLTVADGSGPPERVPDARPGLPDDVLRLPRLQLPNRAYLLFAGPLAAALRMGHQITDDWFVPQSPSLLWPADRSWCLATEIDFDSTLVGGPAELAEALLAAPGLEAWAVPPDGDLTLDGDLRNPRPPVDRRG